MVLLVKQFFHFCNVQVTWQVFPILLPSVSIVVGSARKGQNVAGSASIVVGSVRKGHNVVANSRFLLFSFIIVVGSVRKGHNVVANSRFLLFPFIVMMATFSQDVGHRCSADHP